MIGAEFLIERPDGSRIPILGSAAPLRGSDGTVIGAVGVFQDVSERMRAEEAIRSRERLLSGIFEILPIGLWIADEGGQFVRANAAAVRVWAGRREGLADFRLANGSWADTGTPVTADEWPLARALKGEQVIEKVMRIQALDGSQKTIISSALPLSDDSGRLTGAIVVNQDISDLKRAEDALRRAVQSRDQVLAIVAHDLRNPLSGILFAIEVLERRRTGVADEAEARPLEMIRRQATRMNRLIQDLLDVARIESGVLSVERTRVAVQPLMREVLDTQQAIAAAASMTLRLDTAGQPTDVWGDRERIIQVFENLIGNAVKFAPPGGVISLGAKSRESDTVLWVADTGPGIPPDMLPHLFDRFWQANRADNRGAGLGLAIVKGIVEAHGGHIWVESEPGAGTTIFFSVRNAERQDPPHEPADHDSGS